MATRHVHQGSSENILKQGYLKKSVQTSDVVPSASKQLAKNIKQRFEPNRWYVFGVRNRTPYLEYFEKEESIFTGSPIDSYDLSSFQNLSYTMGRTNTNYTFCIFLAESTIELTAPSRAHMLEWCRCLERNLRNLGLRSKHLKEDHQYTAFPVKGDYKPTKTSIDDMNEGTTLEDQLVEAAGNISDDDTKDHEYQDATLLKLDNNVDSTVETLPVRPPPRIPKRGGQEEVFASLSTVRREEMYSNFEEINHDVHDNEKHLFDTSSDSESEKDVPFKGDKTTLVRRSLEERFKNEEIEDEEDRCSSLPVIPSAPHESDTSEDSDFISASFWLRNRKPEKKSLNYDTPPPRVPIRCDSAKPKPASRKCVSMNIDYLKPVGSPRCVSPSLESLGQAPALPDRSYKDNDSNDGNLKFVDTGAISHEQQKPTVLIIDSGDWFPVDKSSHVGLESKISAPNKCDVGPSDDNGGEYEILLQKPPPRTNKPSTINLLNGSVQDDVYEATWECSSARRSNSDEEDGVCCSGGKEFEKLSVAMPIDKNEKSACNGNVHMRNKESDANSQKHRSVLSKIFHRKSKDKDLPERLLVADPSDDHQQSNGCSEETVDASTDGNFYSDFPSPTACQKPCNFDSDILKLSLLENVSTSNQDSPPIELPRRNFGQNGVKTSVIDGTRQKQNLSNSTREPLQCFNQNAYEPIDYQSQRPRAPSPPAKSKLSKGFDLDFNSEEAPIAPPRRNRKSDKSTEHVDSLESQNVKMCAGSPPIPKKKQSVKAALSVSSRESTREPDLPPRNHNDSDKPAVPPLPRKGVVVLRSASDGSGGAVGARPKTINFVSWQQSFSQPSELTMMNLKQNQVDILKSEIESTGGLVKVISKVHFQSGLALVECFNRIWIAGWDVRKFPRLFDKFHIGDELVSINDVQVTDLSFVHKLVKNVKAENIEISIKRLPYAKVFAIQRSAEGESIGIKREGGTAEIVYVDPLGLAYKHGLPSKAMTLDGNGLCNWTLTEINMRPLNLFFKDSEIERRLLAVGRDISIVVQPSEFIKDLKKQLKKLRGYKDFIIK